MKSGRRIVRRRSSRRLMAEINVVPYIDVMLVLLVIFMVTAPLVTTGVKVSLPRERAGGIAAPTTDSVVITVDRLGRYYLDVGDDDRQPIADQALFDRLRIVLRRRADTPVLVRADNQVDYGRVVRAMVLAQTAGAPDVGLITTPPERSE